MDDPMTADQIVALLDLRPLPGEGGFYAETHRGAPLAVGGSDTPTGRRSVATAIYYLVTREAFSAMHRLPADEVFHFYLGDPVEQLQLFPDGSGRVVAVGPNLGRGERPQVVVPAGVWQGARPTPDGRRGFTLLGTTVAPGFEFVDFEAGRREDLVAAFPAFRDLIVALTRQPE